MNLRGKRMTFVWHPFALPDAPTLAEIDAGVDLTFAIERGKRMGNFQIGDRVHVEFDGTVNFVGGVGELIDVTPDGGGDVGEIPTSFATKLPPRVKVGDVISDREAHELPPNSAVLCLANGLPYVVKGARSGSHRGLFYGSVRAVRGGCGTFRVLHVA